MSKVLMNAVAAAGSVAIVLATTGPALAAPSNAVYVKNASSTSGSVAFTATNTNAFQVLDLRSNLAWQCAAGNVNLGGKITLGTARAVSPLTTITSATFRSCTFSNIPVSWSPVLPWNVSAPNVSTTPSPPQGAGAAPAGQITAGTFTGVRANITIASCTFVLGNGTGGTGTVNPVRYTNGSSTSPSSLSILTTDVASSATLGVNSIGSSPCWGSEIMAGDKFQFSGLSGVMATFAVVPASGGPLNIEAYNTSIGF